MSTAKAHTRGKEQAAHNLMVVIMKFAMNQCPVVDMWRAIDEFAAFIKRQARKESRRGQ